MFIVIRMPPNKGHKDYMPLYIEDDASPLYLDRAKYSMIALICRRLNNSLPQHLLFLNIHRRLQKKRHVLFLGQTPLPVPPPGKKGTNLLFFQIGIHLHTHQDLNLECCRVIGQKLRYRRPCTRELPGTHKWLAQSHFASISSKFH